MSRGPKGEKRPADVAATRSMSCGSRLAKTLPSAAFGGFTLDRTILFESFVLSKVLSFRKFCSRCDRRCQAIRRMLNACLGSGFEHVADPVPHVMHADGGVVDLAMMEAAFLAGEHF